jgi:hypothetical protein
MGDYFYVPDGTVVLNCVGFVVRIGEIFFLEIFFKIHHSCISFASVLGLNIPIRTKSFGYHSATVCRSYDRSKIRQMPTL